MPHRPSAIIMFHGVDQLGSILSVSPEQFSSLIASIERADYTVVGLHEILANPGEGQVALTFDDGFDSVLEADRLLEGRPATLFVTTQAVGGSNDWEHLANQRQILGWDQMGRLLEGSWRLESHTVNHPDLRGLSDQEVVEEFEHSKASLRAELGVESTVLAYPYGYANRRVSDLAARHFSYAVSTRFAPLESDAGKMLLPRLDAYYLRQPATHRAFGGRRFWSYVKTRGLLRRLRAHPGESVPR